MGKHTGLFLCLVLGLTLLWIPAGGSSSGHTLLAAKPAQTAEAPAQNPCAQVASKAAVSTEATPATTEAAEADVARPSNPGGPGPALDLVGDPTSGAKIFVDNCQKCHGEQGQGGVKNPGSDDGTVPALNPIDETLIDKDPKVYACDLDLFIEHGSTPQGSKPQQVMAAAGDTKQLTPQQIADVIAYVISLNPVPAEATAAPTDVR